jgi:hypothetical protein
MSSRAARYNKIEKEYSVKLCVELNEQANKGNMQKVSIARHHKDPMRYAVINKVVGVENGYIVFYYSVPYDMNTITVPGYHANNGDWITSEIQTTIHWDSPSKDMHSITNPKRFNKL